MPKPINTVATCPKKKKKKYATKYVLHVVFINISTMIKFLNHF